MNENKKLSVQIYNSNYRFPNVLENNYQQLFHDEYMHEVANAQYNPREYYWYGIT
jgi:hypothetical protein